jgi:hypothetical protein
MIVSSPSTFDLINTYVHLKDGAEAVPVAVGDDFWATIDKRTELHSRALTSGCTGRCIPLVMRLSAFSPGRLT